MSTDLTPQAAHAVVASLHPAQRRVASSRGRRRGLGTGFKGIAAR
ncbi:hypothetical protein [Streptomyces hydrogenans]